MKTTVIGESNIDIAVVPYAEPSAKGCVPGTHNIKREAPVNPTLRVSVFNE